MVMSEQGAVIGTRSGDRYTAETKLAGLRIAVRLKGLGITDILVSPTGVDDFEGDLARVRDEIFQQRLNEGYELSYRQLCNSFVQAAGLIDPNYPISE